ncbi:double-strand break repair helicase AddA [Devosia rhodophyticola]|uniref:DNA 3'-5' helicase n=1 Tax=Devosia rhodophyticola TaxID=3026423 RepID=A0ABY7Z0C5_9HYPH|nr:double-strand break repair helicase AddA [Devosia rhodophyticola]WDR06919.1 double-strand break repair helicase AddA [Devosia rhodophyticola]
MNRSFLIPPDTAENQRLAADPDYSIWVAANAGSGKTHVLTQRVLRLLLSGVPPQSILCLTYTKAAAAEMRRRVSGVLAKWAVMTQRALDVALFGLDGQSVDAEKRALARTLFARALETPGGLKIVTIHAFCESVLHRFPLEAKVPFDFSVVEEDEQGQMILEAREAVLAVGLAGEEHAEAVAVLFDLLSDDQIGKAIMAALADGRKLRAILANRETAKANLRKLVRLENGPSVSAIEAKMLNERLIGPAEIVRLLEICPPNGKGISFESKLARLDPRTPRLGDWLKAFLKADGEIPSKFPKKAFVDADPELAALVREEAERLAMLVDLRNSAQLLERSEALLEVVGAISDRFERRKRARSLLDFDDLIEKLAALFADKELGAWVQYKLDAGITHILVDESQDTNPRQWRVVEAIAREFFTGDSAVERPRSVFAVGDQKQSIYSFQGADPTLFGKTGDDFRQRAENANRPFKLLPLNTSFRTLKGVLEAVDLVTKRPDVRAALLATHEIEHQTARAEEGGTVTLWPPVHQPNDENADDQWPLEAQAIERSAPRQVAERIAGEIAGWVKSGRTHGPHGQVVTPNDVLILVQARNGLFHEIIRALIKAGLPTPGADRLAVTSHIGVLDLLALCDVLLNPTDDLQLAALLRSPLFDISEEHLFDLAHGRGPQTLWRRLGSSGLQPARDAAERLQRWRAQLDFERPFEFFAAVLYGEGGLKRFHARFGGEIDDVFAEFLTLALEHEQTEQPSLQGFVTAMRARQVSIKRDLAETGSGVRVMTVHGAKGLEAPIVILADAATTPTAQKLGKPVYLVEDSPGPLLIHASKNAQHTEETRPFRIVDEDNQKAEYWRKLYVGMTRAEDELYVTGALTPGTKPQSQLKGSWYEAIETALRPDADTICDDNGVELAVIYPATRPAPSLPVTATVNGPTSVEPLVLADLPAHSNISIVRPSSAFEEVGDERVLDTMLERLERLDPALARQQGIALHALLQHLGRVPRADWPVVLDRAMPVLLPEAPQLRDPVRAKAISILTRPALGEIFGPNSRAEVPFLVNGIRRGKAIKLAGRIDRLVITPDSVSVVDYKSDAQVPSSAEAVPRQYLTQLGLYALVAGQLFPGKTIKAQILWTELESLMNLPHELLRHMVSDFTLG